MSLFEVLDVREEQLCPPKGNRFAMFARSKRVEHLFVMLLEEARAVDSSGKTVVSKKM